MHKSILKIILILYIFLHICHVESEVVEENEVDDIIYVEVTNGELPEENGGNGKSSTGDDVVTSDTSNNKTNETIVTKVETTTSVNPNTPVVTFTTVEHDFFELRETTSVEPTKVTTSEKPTVKPEKSTTTTTTTTTPPSPINKEVPPTPTPAPVIVPPNEEENEEENKIAPVTTKAKETDYFENIGNVNVDNNNYDGGNENQGSGLFLTPENGNKNPGAFGKIGAVVIFVGTVSIGLVAVSGYQVYKRKNEKGLKHQEYIDRKLSHSSLTPSEISDSHQRASLSQSLIFDNDSQSQAFDMYYSAKSLEEKEEPQKEPQKEQRIVNVDTLTYQSPKPRPQSQISIESATSKTASIGRNSLDRNSLDRNSLGRNSTRSTISRNSIVRHSFLNPNIRIVRTGKRTQQLFEATNEHPAIIETFPSMERPYEPAVPVPLEESDTNSLHPHSIYQMYQDEMEFENYYAYTIDDKEYIIDPTTNRVLEIHDLTTDEYVLVEEELYLDFSGSDDSDSDKQTL